MTELQTSVILKVERWENTVAEAYGLWLQWGGIFTVETFENLYDTFSTICKSAVFVFEPRAESRVYKRLSDRTC